MVHAQELAVGTHSATSAAPFVRPPGGVASDLIEELDRSLQQLQHACHGEPGPDGEPLAVATGASVTAQHVCTLVHFRATVRDGSGRAVYDHIPKSCTVLQVWISTHI